MSNMYAIKGSTLTAIGDAIRKKAYGFDEIPYLNGDFTLSDYIGGLGISEAFFELPDVKKMKVIMTPIGSYQNKYGGYSNNAQVGVYCGITKNGTYIPSNRTFLLPYDTVFPYEFICDYNTIGFHWDSSSTNKATSFNVQLIALTDDGEEYTYTPLEMADKINNSFEEITINENGIYTPQKGNMGFSKVEVDAPLIPESALIISGNCQYKFAYNGWDWFIPHIKDTENITNASYMFYFTTGLTEIPFDINLDGKKQSVSYLCGYSKINTPPVINNFVVDSINYIFDNTQYISYFPDGYGSNWDWSNVDNSTSAYGNSMGNLFSGCYSLRKYPIEFFKHYNPSPNLSYHYSNYYGAFNNCYALDEIVNMTVFLNAFTSNAFYCHINSCARLKDYTFEVNDDGTPKVAPWKSQILDFSTAGYLVYDFYKSSIINDSTGITADKQVKDDATYQALKNDPDWFSADVNYSRYNHTSAVNTINSLPDCSATGTNTIKFKGSSGALTDGGAINTLTEEEIAVATAKGWTVSLV